MNIKPIQIIPPGYVDILHPETDSSVVLMEDGSTLEQFKGDTNTEFSKIETNYPLTGISRQAIINGNFDIWQRGVEYLNPNDRYTVDRWYFINNIDVNIKVFRSTDVPNANSRYSLRAEQYGALSDNSITVLDVIQKIEDYTFFRGKTITVSGYYKVDTGYIRPFVTDGITPNASPALDATTWTYFTFTRNVAINATKLEIGFELPRKNLPIGKGFNLTQIQVNVGDTALPFQPKSFAEELKDCQRYYEKSYPYNTSIFTSGSVGSHYHSGMSDSGGYIYTTGYFKVPKRITPTITAISVVTGAIDKWYLSKNDWQGDAWVNFVSSENGFIASVSTTTLNVSANMAGHWVADAEL